MDGMAKWEKARWQLAGRVWNTDCILEKMMAKVVDVC